jgi:4-amino-4-deoxy-L-arabinose transferase-like glycosyltransferase
VTKAENKDKHWILMLILLLLAIVVVRVPFLLGEVLGGDAAYHARAAVVVLNGGLLYRDVPYTYPPLYAYTEALGIALLGDTSIGWRAVAQAYDIGSVVLIFLIVSRIFGQKKAFLAAALYGFSPLPMIATSTYVSFDSTAVFWMLASILLLLNKKTVPSAVALGIGTAYKYFPLLLLPLLLIHLSEKRARILYFLTSVATVAIIQLPFALSDFSAWLYNVLIFHVERSAGGATIYNLLSLHPQLWEVQTPLTILSPISLMLIFLLVAFDHDRTEHGLLKKAALVMVTAVFFNKVVLFYALWFIPLVCTFIVAQRRRQFIYVFVPFVTLQVALLAAVHFYMATITEDSTVFAMCYIYLLTSALLLIWLLRDRLLSLKEQFRRQKSKVQSTSPHSKNSEKL